LPLDIIQNESGFQALKYTGLQCLFEEIYEQVFWLSVREAGLVIRRRLKYD